MGVEYSDESARTARRHFPVVLASELEALPDAAFDHISMLHSLEHVERPLETLSLLARKLKPGGTLFVEVPYLDCLEYRIFRRHYAMIQAPLHLQFFSDRTMAFMAPNAGLKLHRVRDNLWTPVHYVWSFLNAIDAPIDRRRKITLNTLLFPLVLPPVAVGSALGIPGVARQYTFTRADRAGSDTRPRAIPVRFERR
jgi:SAM-dependent methyltransferase